MKQLSLFDHEHTQKPASTHTRKHIWKIFVDGASRGNPGPAGAGIYVLKDGEKESEHGFYLGKKTNNQAEYLALLLGLFYVTRAMKKHDTLHIISDSQLLIRQLQRIYKVKDEQLQIYHAKALDLLTNFSYTTKHVLRAENSNADALANYGIDKKIPIDKDFTTWLHNT